MTLAALLVVCGSLVGCGAGSTRNQEPERRAVALARVINLTASDLPRATVVAGEGHNATSGCSHGVQFHSPTFESGYELDRATHPPQWEVVVSSVALASSDAAARRAVLYFRTAAGQRCVLKTQEEDRSESGPLVSHHTTLAASPVEPPSPGFALTTTQTQIHRSAHGHAPTPLEHAGEDGVDRVATDLIGFAVGRAWVTLVDLHEPGHTPLTNEHRLVRLLHARAKAHTP